MIATGGKTRTEFVRLIDASLAEVSAAQEDVGEANWRRERYQQLVVNLQTMRDTVASGGFPRPSRGEVPGGTGLALIKAANEWCDNRAVLACLIALDEFYRTRV